MSKKDFDLDKFNVLLFKSYNGLGASYRILYKPK